MADWLQYTTVARLKSYIGIESTVTDHDAILTRILNSASRHFDKALARHSKRIERIEYFSISRGDSRFTLPGYPVKLDPDPLSATYGEPMVALVDPVNSTSYQQGRLLDFDMDPAENGRGEITLYNVYSYGPRSIKATYTGGIATATTVEGTDGVCTDGGEGADDIFTSASADFVRDEVAVGDEFTITGGDNAGTYTVKAITDLHTITIDESFPSVTTPTSDEVWNFTDKGLIAEYPELEEAMCIYLTYMWRNKDRLDLGSASIGGANVSFIADKTVKEQVAGILNHYKRWV